MFQKQVLTLTSLMIVLTSNMQSSDAHILQDQTAQQRVAELELQACFELAGDNKAELAKAIKDADPKHQAAVEFLICNMPEHDLKNLSSKFILNNVKSAFRVRDKANWKIPDDIFLNNVLPYANIDEPRDPWRRQFSKLCLPMVADCKTPTEAAQKLNATVFAELAVKYSTARKRANQSPKESIEQGLASCTGLSIILVDACRSVGVPARLAGIPSWKNKKGNHTWVEIWDDGWHFTGAAEYNPQGLNRTWFQGDASLADATSELHSIYAVSFQKTDTVFPMVWSPEKRVYAENVTSRYVPKQSEKHADAKVNLMIRVWNADKSERLVAEVKVFKADSDKAIFDGRTKAGTADMNDLLAVQLEPKSKYKLELQTDKSPNSQAALVKYDLVTGNDPDQLFEIVLKSESSLTNISQEENKPLTDVQQKILNQLADKTFVEAESASTDSILKSNPIAVRKLAWERYLASPLARKGESDFTKNQVTFEKHLSPYTIKEVGKRPENGWPLFIAMHGGGGAPQRLNDSQWEHMKIYYKDQSQVTGYKYLALRAPNNTWNGFYDDYVYPLIENLIQQCVVFGDVDPNKVFIMGYSHGGYGAFAIGPKIPHRFAAVHASAAAPTDGQTTAKTLRNTRFTFMVGEKDTAYGRRKRCEKFADQIKELGYSNVEFLYKPGFGHGGLPDRDMIGQMYEHVRNPVPKHLTWEQTDSVVDRFFWLAVDKPKKGNLIDAEIEGNKIKVKPGNCTSFSIFLDQRLIADPNQPVDVVIAQADGERSYSIDYKPNFETLCNSLAKTGDINLAFDFEIKINLEE